MATTARVKLTLSMVKKLEKGETLTFRIPEGIREVQITHYEPSINEIFEEFLKAYGLTEKRDNFSAIFMDIFSQKK